MTNVYQRLESLESHGIKLGLQNIQCLLKDLGNPEQGFPSILIAGTNGKGSVGAMLSKILSLNGYRSGHYLSPHLVDVRERIQIEGPISSEDFESVLADVFYSTDQLLRTSKLSATPTYFETLTAACFHYFRKKKVDFAVIEVGLGGRFDATNTVPQKLSIITSIDFDHEQHLGSTLESIATEKAGILKNSAPIVTGILPEEAQTIITAIAAQKQSRIRTVRINDLHQLSLENGFPVFHYIPWDETVRVNLRGRHQAFNAAVALEAADELAQMGLSVSQSVTLIALRQVYWPGRLQLVSENPHVMLDCAHNPMGAKALLQFLQEMGWRKVVFLFTAMKDKNIDRMLKTISPVAARIYLTRVEPFLRCATFESLASVSQNVGIPYEIRPDSVAAFEEARQNAADSGMPLVIFGSIYLIGKILANCKFPLE